MALDWAQSVIPRRDNKTAIESSCNDISSARKQ